MSASLHVDFGNTMLFVNSLSTPGSSGGNVISGVGTFGAVVGNWVDMSNSDTFCGVYVAVAGGVSGPLPIAVQTARGINDIPLTGSGSFSGNQFSGGAPTSGSFTDPTSGLAQLPTWFSSGGILWVNSGLYTVPGGASATPPASGTTLVNGYPAFTLPYGPTPIQNAQGGIAGEGNLSGAFPVMASGGIAFANFQRNYQYARLVLLSGATQYPGITAGFMAQLDTTGSGTGYSWQPLSPNAGVLV